MSDILVDRSSGLWLYDPAWPEGAPRPLYLDGCPSCVRALNVPKRVAPRGEGVRADYVCHVCGHVWFTGWQRDPDDVESLPLDDIGDAVDEALRRLRGDS